MKFSVVIVVLLYLFMCPNGPSCESISAANQWSSHGPYGGWVTSFTFPEPGVIFAEGALFRSTDRGMNWQRLSMGGQLRFHPAAPQKMVSLSLSALSESTDRGLTWKPLPENDLIFEDVQFRPENPLWLSALANTTRFDYFRSTDGGSSWIAIPATGMPHSLQTSAKLTIDSTNGKRQFLLLGGYRVFRTTDGGNNWMQIFSRPNSLSLSTIVVDASKPSNVYAGGDEGVFKSTDGGRAWSSAQCSCAAQQIAIDPFDSQHIVAVGRDGQRTGRRRAVASYDGGRTWGNIGLSPKLEYIAVGFDPFLRQNLMVGSTLAGIFRSTDGGRSFLPSNRGIDQLTSSDVAHDPANSAHLLAVTDVGLFESTNSGDSWKKKALPFTPRPLRVQIHPLNPRNWLLQITSGLATTVNSGLTWDLRTLPGAQFFAWDPRNANILYTSFAAGKVSRSTDMGRTWQNRGGGLPAATIYTIEVSPANGNWLYLGTEQRKVYLSTDAGKSWSARSNGLYNGGYGRIYQIALHPLNPNIAYAIGEWHFDNEEFPVLFKSVDAGKSWTRPAWSDDFTYPQITPTRIVINEATPNELFVTDEHTCYTSADGGVSWKALSRSGLESYPDISFYELDYAAQSNSLISATTNGVFVTHPE